MAITGIIVNGALYKIDYDSLENKPVDQYAIDKEHIYGGLSDALQGVNTLTRNYENLSTSVTSLEQLSSDIADINTRLYAAENRINYNLLPDPSPEEAGKILQVNANGEWGLIWGLPGTIAGADTGKVLQIDSNGRIIKSKRAIPMPADGDTGKYLRVDVYGQLVYDKVPVSIPQPSASYAGQILKVASDGTLQYSAENFLPNVTSANAGMYLCVDENGNWALGDGVSTIPFAEEETF